MTLEKWLDESDFDYCKIGNQTFCKNCMNGEHEICIIAQDYELGISFSCDCKCDTGDQSDE